MRKLFSHIGLLNYFQVAKASCVTSVMLLQIIFDIKARMLFSFT